MVRNPTNDPIVHVLLDQFDKEALGMPPLSRLIECTAIYSLAGKLMQAPSQENVLNSRNLFVLAEFNLRTSGERALALLSTLAKANDTLTSIRAEILDTDLMKPKTSSTDGEPRLQVLPHAHISEELTQALAQVASTLDSSLALLASDMANASAALRMLMLRVNQSKYTQTKRVRNEEILEMAAEGTDQQEF